MLATTASSQIMLALDSDDHAIYQLNVNTGAKTFVHQLTFPPLNFPTSIGYNSLDGCLYIWTAGGAGQTANRLNLSTWEMVETHDWGNAKMTEGGMAPYFQGGVARAYGGSIDEDGTGDMLLFETTMSGGFLNIIGSMGSYLDVDMNGLEMTAQGQLIGINGKNNQLVEISTIDASLTPIATLNSTVGIGGGLTIWNNLYYYSTAGPSGGHLGGSDEFRVYNPTTGTDTWIGDLNSAYYGISSLAFCGTGILMKAEGYAGGSMDFKIFNATPNSPVAYCYAAGTGSHSVFNPITGNTLVTGLASAQFTTAIIQNADGDGNCTATATVPPSAAGVIFVQAFDAATDRASAVAGL